MSLVRSSIVRAGWLERPGGGMDGRSVQHFPCSLGNNNKERDELPAVATFNLDNKDQ